MKVGETLNDVNLREIVGEYELGERKSRGERLSNFVRIMNSQ